MTRSRNAFRQRRRAQLRITHLLMLDADVVVDPDGIERLVPAGHDVSGAVVALRQIGWHRARAHLDVRPEASANELRSIANGYAIRMLPGERPVDGFVRVHSIGSAAMLVSRSALVELSDTDLVERVETGLPGPDGDGSGWTFFDPAVDTDGAYLSEDYAFCDRWRSSGGSVWADLQTPTRHIGPVSIQGDIGRSVTAAASALRVQRAQGGQ